MSAKQHLPTVPSATSAVGQAASGQGQAADNGASRAHLERSLANARQGPVRLLPYRARLESSFGRDLSRVLAHYDDEDTKVLLSSAGVPAACEGAHVWFENARPSRTPMPRPKPRFGVRRRRSPWAPREGQLAGASATSSTRYRTWCLPRRATWPTPWSRQHPARPTMTFTLTSTAQGSLLSLVHTGFEAHQKQDFGGARMGWKSFAGRLVDLLSRSPP